MRHQWRKAKLKSGGSGSKGLTPYTCVIVAVRLRKELPERVQAIYTSVRPASTKDCTSGNETAHALKMHVPVCLNVLGRIRIL